MHVKKIVMLWVAVLALALPLLLISTAGATVPVAGTYNTDAAVQVAGASGLLPGAARSSRSTALAGTPPIVPV